MKQKIISLCLALTICITLCTPAFASTTSSATYPEVFYPDTIHLIYTGNHIYEQVAATNLMAANSEVLTATKSADGPEIYAIESQGEYLLPVGDSFYHVVDKISLDIKAEAEIAFLDVPVEVKDAIRADFAQSGEVHGALYVPQKLKTRDIESTMNYKYGAYNMRQYLYTYNNKEATNVHLLKGARTKEKAAAAINMVFTVGSKIVKKVSLFSTAASLLKDFLTITQSDAAFSAASGDSVDMTPHWNRYLKFTYCDAFHNGNFLLGLKSISAQLLYVEFDAYFANANSGTSLDWSLDFNKYIYSPHYTAPDATAVSSATSTPTLEDYLDWDFTGESGELLCRILID